MNTAGDILINKEPKHRINKSQLDCSDLALFCIESFPDAVIVSDIEEIIVLWNRAAEWIYGFLAHEVIGKPLSVIFPSDTYSHMERSFERLLHDEQIEPFETECLNENSRLISVEITSSTIKNTDGIIIGFSMISHTRTDQKNLNHWFHLLSESMDKAPDGIRIVKPDGTVIYGNTAFDTMYGFPSKEYLGKNVDELYADPSLVHSTVIPILNTLGRWDGEVVAKHKDGTNFPIWLTSARIDHQGKPVAFVGIIRDITERRKLEELKKEFLSVISHELKTPITTLKLMTQVHMHRFSQSPTVQVRLSDFQLIDQELDRLVRLINDILDDSRIETGKLNLRFSEVNMAGLVSNVVDKMRIFITDHQITISDLLDVSVIADEERVEQVLINLISNAAKYSSSGKAIQVYMSRSKNRLQVYVRDQGIGIPKAKHKLIFDRFYQVKAHKSGFGLGLYISNQIIIRHKGKIRVQSAKNKGSIFSFSLPIAQTN